MIPKTLRNPALRTKFKVGSTVQLPQSVWQHFVTPVRMRLPKLPTVIGVVKEAADRMIETRKPNGGGVNRHCRFAVALDSPQINEVTVWEEWMLEKISVCAQPIPAASVTDTLP